MWLYCGYFSCRSVSWFGHRLWWLVGIEMKPIRSHTITVMVITCCYGGRMVVELRISYVGWRARKVMVFSLYAGNSGVGQS